MKRVILPQIALLLTACDQQPPPAKIAQEPWPNEAEVLFQQAEVLRYELEQRKLESERLQAQGLVGAPPMPRRESAAANMASDSSTTGQSVQRE